MQSVREGCGGRLDRLVPGLPQRASWPSAEVPQGRTVLLTPLSFQGGAGGPPGGGPGAPMYNPTFNQGY